MKLLFIGTIALLTGVGSATAQGLGERVQTIGSWTVFKDTDPMTDAVNCLAVYKENDQIQLTSTSLAFGMGKRGGLASYTLRFDDLPAGEMKLASRVEKGVGAAFIEGKDFASLKRSKRVRFQALTGLAKVVNEDVDVTEANAVWAFFRELGCKD